MPSSTSQSADAATDLSLDELCINAVRILAMDAVQKADSGHPGAPMGLAPLAYALFTRHMRHNPADPAWPNRDRFVLSNGHASMLLYSSLYLSGYELSLEDLKQFRQWMSHTPGHPEYGYTPGVETTTGPLGQGLANAVGMALAEAHLAAVFNRDGFPVVDHFTYFIAGDGCMMEGISHEAASFAGHFKLGKLIGFYDDNRISIDGPTDLSFTDDTAKRFEAYGWQVLHITDVNDLTDIDRAIAEAKSDPTRPTLVVTRTHIGFGSPNRQDTAKAHGEALGEQEVELTRKRLGWPWEERFFVPDEVVAHWRKAKESGSQANDSWRQLVIGFAKAEPELAKEFGRRMHGDLPAGWQNALPKFTRENGSVATRAASGAVLSALAPLIPELVGGSADLTPSNNTMFAGAKDLRPGSYENRYVRFGVREHAMCAMMNGMMLHGGIRPYGGTFLVFSDYMRPAIRLAAFMHQPTILVFTHDSIGLGEDGPTHQPIEHLSSLRCIPNLTVLRPADSAETVEAWRTALLHKDGPVALVLTRQKLAFIDDPKRAPASEVARGGYVLIECPCNKPDLVLMASGSEVGLIVSAQQRLHDEFGICVRAVSMPSHELFLKQTPEYRESVLPRGVPRIAIEAAHPMSWDRFLADGDVSLGIERFGASAPYQRIFTEFGLTVDHLVAEGRRLTGK